MQNEYTRQLNLIRKGNKTSEQRKTLDDIINLFNARNMAIKFIEDYDSMILEAKRMAKHDVEGLKILTPNQMLKDCQ